MYKANDSILPPPSWNDTPRPGRGIVLPVLHYGIVVQGAARSEYPRRRDILERVRAEGEAGVFVLRLSRLSVFFELLVKGGEKLSLEEILLVLSEIL